MRVTNAINIFLYQSVNVGGLPFDLRDEIPNKETLAAMQETENIIAGRIQAKVYHSVAEMNADLDAELDEEDE